MWLYKFFQKLPKEVHLVSQETEDKFMEAVKMKKEADYHFHNIKATVAPKTIEVFLEALRDGKVQKEPHHG